MNPMKEALSRRRGKASDLSIIIGLPEGAQVGVGAPEEKQTDLAPPPAAPEGEEEISPEEVVAKPGLPEENLEEPAEDGSEEMREEMMSRMSPQDMEDLKSRKPRSIGDRAKMLAMKG